jgi:hypothetical protein
MEAKHLSVVNLKLDTADKEYRFRFPSDTIGFTMQARNGNKIRWSDKPGIVSDATMSPYFTMKIDTAYDDQELWITNFSQELYFACSIANEVLEISLKTKEVK